MKPLNKQRGQVAVFYALLIPIFLLMGGVGLDLGWYYLNVSRLQNAADAAVLVGAKTLVDKEKFDDGTSNPVYGYKVKLVEKYPASNGTSEDFDATIAHNEALSSAMKNLSNNSVVIAPPSLFSVAEAYSANSTFNDAYARGDTPEVTLESSLYKSGSSYYYVVSMNENVQHFFIGFLDDMNAGVVAVAKISENGSSDNDDDASGIKVKFDANGGKFDNGEETTDAQDFKSPKQMSEDEVSDPITSKEGKPTREGMELAGWSTVENPSADEIIDFIPDGKQLTKKEMEKFFGNNTEVTLYAVWKNTNPTPNDPPPSAKPKNNKTLWEQMQYLIAKNVYHYNWDTSTNIYGSSSLINNRFNYAKAYDREPSASGTVWYNGEREIKKHPQETENKTVWVEESWERTTDSAAENDTSGNYRWVSDSSGTSYRWVKTNTEVNGYEWVTDNSSSNWRYKRKAQLSNQEYYYGDWTWVKTDINPLTKRRIGGHYESGYYQSKNSKEYGYYRYKEYGYYEKKIAAHQETITVVTKEAWTEIIWKDGHYAAPPSNQTHNYYTETLEWGSDKSDGAKAYSNIQYDFNSYTDKDGKFHAGTTHYFLDFWQEGQSTEYKSYDGTLNRSELQASAKAERTGGDRSKVIRMHSLFNVNVAYPVRTDQAGNKVYGDDPLYCRIEAEPYASEYTAIRQLVININIDNTSDAYRPLFIYYDGPDARTSKNETEVIPGKLEPEKAQPVILNLNADFKGVLFMPDIPVIINGNNHKFEGFIIAKEYHYLDTGHGVKVKYSSRGERDKDYTDNKITVDANGNVCHLKADGATAMDLWNNNGTNVFGLDGESCFKMFSAASGIKYAYIHYNFESPEQEKNVVELDKTPFYNDMTGELIPLYKKVNGKEVRVTKWEDVKLYGLARDGSYKEIPKKLSKKEKDNSLDVIRALTRSSKLKSAADLDSFRGIVLLDGDESSSSSQKELNPIALQDEAGNPIYFCEDYVKMVGSYDVITLDNMGNKLSTKEFLLTKSDADGKNVTNSEKWT